MDRTTAIAILGAVALAMATIAVASPEATTDPSDDVAEPDRHADTVVDTASRRVYKVDDIGMIIGGASEDAKAKVRRLPVQK